MGASIVLRSDNKLSFGTGYQLGSMQDLGNIVFSIPSSMVAKEAQVFLIVRQKDGFKDAIPLTATGTKKETGYTYYQMPATQALHLYDNAVQMAIMLLERDDTYTVSNFLNATINLEHYEFARKAAIARTMERSIAKYYEGIVNLLTTLSQREEINNDC